MKCSATSTGLGNGVDLPGHNRIHSSNHPPRPEPSPPGHLPQAELQNYTPCGLGRHIERLGDHAGRYPWAGKHELDPVLWRDADAVAICQLPEPILIEVCFAAHFNDVILSPIEKSMT